MHLNWPSVLVWGFAATVILTTLMAGGQTLKLTRMDIPFLLGTMVTPDRSRARVYGFLLHVMNGWIFALVYAAAFQLLGGATFWFGALTGLVHASFVLTVGLPALPGVHPRMASSMWGPDVTPMLEPPGFLALNYGRQTAIATILAHLVYGAILGTFYQVR